MGNNPSAPSGQGHDQQAAAGSSTPTTASQPGSGSQSPRQSRRSARNIMSTTHNRSAVPPEASLAQARGSTVVSRPKSIPGSTAVSSLSGSPHSNASPLTSASAGAASRAATSTSGPSAIPIASAAAAGSSSIAASMEAPAPASASAASGPLPAPAPRADEPSKPVDVPRESSAGHTYPHAHFNSDLATAQSDQLTSVSSVTDTYYMTHPPRMPLPIEEEVHTPGSPILGPQDGSDIPPMAGSEGAASYSSDGLTRKGSGISTNTAEDEDTDELQVDKTRPVVPTKVEWKRGGDKVYVTGSIFQWNRKQRLHPVEGRPGCFAAVIPVLPGTHHVRFLVDGIMQTSPELPTTVDFGNNLVNYIEVNPEDAHRRRHRHQHSQHSKQHGQHSSSSAAASATTSPTPEDSSRGASRNSSISKDKDDAKAKAAPRIRSVPPPDAYRREIPQYLQDFDQAEESPAYQRAVTAIEKLPTPPSLPGFLGKPILNAAVLMKDDNSVLGLPNHTVLNHLATSSIKNGVLAVSATTRYRNKYVTTIIYKPTSADDG